MSIKPVVIIFGGSGVTGQSVVNGLLERGDFVSFIFIHFRSSTTLIGIAATEQTVRIAARPISVQKQVLVDFQRRGAEIATIDLAEDSDEQLEVVLQGVNTVICTLAWNSNHLQPRLVDAAVKAGVKRFIPSDFGTPGRKGVRLLLDDVCILFNTFNSYPPLHPSLTTVCPPRNWLCGSMSKNQEFPTHSLMLDFGERRCLSLMGCDLRC